MILDLFDDPRLARRETYRLHEWLNGREMTAVITAKASPRGGGPLSHALEFLQFMVDCSIFLRHEMIDTTSQRSIRIGKFRGSAFEENSTPFGIGLSGVEVAYASGRETSGRQASTERLSSGIERLDTMLGGGYYRGAGVLLTGSPGTAKTTLAGAFAVACCRRGIGQCLFHWISPEEEVVRNLSSVNVMLAPHVESGALRFSSARSSAASAEIHLMHIRDLVHAHKARCLVVDPVSALGKAGNRATVHNVIERLVDWVKLEGITVLCTSLLQDGHANEMSAVQISTLADTWIHLDYVVRSGERNRALSIVKSRGSSHSNQVRELVLDADGVWLKDVYTAGGEVLMGTMRWEKELAERQAERSAGSRADVSATRSRTTSPGWKAGSSLCRTN